MKNILKGRTHKILLIVFITLSILGAIILVRYNYEYLYASRKAELDNLDKSVVITMKHIDGPMSTDLSINCINKHYIDVYERHKQIIGMSRCVICDCGSTGTRIIYYEWLKDNPNSIEVVNYTIIPMAYSTMKKDETIDAYVYSIRLLLMEMLGTGSYQKIPVYFLCTAGFRLLPADHREKLLNAMEKGLRELWPHYQVPPNGVKTITGLDEGLNSWIGINLLKGSFSFINGDDHEKNGNWLYKKIRKLLKKINESPLMKYFDKNRFATIGMLEMGGASAQIGYTINKELADEFYKEKSENDRVYILRLYKRKTNDTLNVYLYISTKLGYGSSCAISKWHSHLKNQNMIQDPCLPKGVPLDLPEIHGYSGKGDWNSCVNGLHSFLSNSDDVIGHKYINNKWKVGKILRERNIAEIPKLFVGISLYYYVASFLRENHYDGSFERDSLIEYSKNILEQDWYHTETAISRTYDSAMTNNMRANGVTHGFKSAWVLNLIYNVMQTSDDPSNRSYINYQFLDSIEGKNLSWTHGVVIRDMMNLMDIYEYNSDESLSIPISTTNRSAIVPDE